MSDGAKAAILRSLPGPVVDASRSAKRRAAQWIYRVTPDARLTPIQRFRRDGHNSLLLKDLPLNSDSVVLDFGGYLGDYTASLLDLYGPRIHVFEPVRAFVDALHERFAGDSRVAVHDYGVGYRDEFRTFGLTDDGTGMFALGAGVPVRFKSAASLNEWLPESLDLAAINIEGGEYELLPALHEAGILPRIDRLFIQFHRLGQEPESQRQQCRQLLSSSHQMVWDYDFVWEAWVRKSA